MAHVPETAIHAYRGQAIEVVTDPVADLTSAGTDTPVLRIDGLDNVNATKEDTDDGLVITAAFTVPADAPTGLHRWQMWVADNGGGNPRPVAGGMLRLEAQVPA